MNIKQLLAEGFKEVSYAPDYFVSSAGEIYSMKSYKGNVGRYLIQNKDSDGYPIVTLCYHGTRKSHAVHLIVANAFLPAKESEKYEEIRHLDGNKLNNSADNLKWGTKKENAIDKKIHGTQAIGSRHGLAKLSENEAKQIKKLISQGERNIDIAKNYGVSVSCISQIRRDLLWKHVI